MSRRARILLVDDRPENLFALEEILASLDQILVSVRTGEQAVKAVLAAYRKEGARLAATDRAVGLVERALRGEVFSPKMQDKRAAPKG